MIFAWIAAARAEDCDIAAVVRSAEASAPRAEISRLDPLRAELVAAARCAPPAPRPLLARFWLAQAALLWVDDRREEALDALISTVRLDPELTDTSYGPEFEALWAEARAAVAAPGSLELSGARPPRQIHVDGEPWSPTAISDGWHLLQLVEANEPRASWARILYLAPAGRVVVEVPALAVPMPVAPAPALPVPLVVLPEPIPLRPVRRKLAPGLLIAGGVTAELAAVGLARYALALQENMDEVSNLRALNILSSRQHKAGWSAYALGGAGIVSVGVGVGLLVGARHD